MMSKELTKKAAEMLLNGATLLSEPCPYCKGVRVMKDGNALCVNCGKEPKVDKKMEPKISQSAKKEKASSNMSETLNILEQKLHSLSGDLDKERDHEKQQQILKSINALLEAINKLRK